MESLKDKLKESINEATRKTKYESPCQLVSTRNSNCAILLGPNLDQPYDEEEVKKICKDMGIKFKPMDDFFDEEEMEEYFAGVMPGAVIEDGELVWYDTYDGTMTLYRI